jgi:hypothetical protein
LTSSIRPLIDFRMSVSPQRRYTGLSFNLSIMISAPGTPLSVVLQRCPVPHVHGIR